MLAIVVAPSHSIDAAAGFATPSFLLPMGDRPFVQHVIEAIVHRGVTQVEFVFQESSEAAVEVLGDGTRWGCKFHFHCLSKAGIRPLLRELTAGPGRVLLGRADRLPAFDSAPGYSWTSEAETTFFDVCQLAGTEASKEGRHSSWSGWAFFLDRASFAEHLRLNNEQALLSDPGHILAASTVRRSVLEREISVSSAEAVLKSQCDLLGGLIPDLAVGGRQLQPGIWVGRNVDLDPTATLVAPVYVGPNCRVGERAHVGPSVVLAEDCLVGTESTIAHSLVGPGTYVGESLEIVQAIVDRNRFIDVRLGTWYDVSDHFLIGSLRTNRLSQSLRPLADKLIAIALLVVFSPLLLISFLIMRLRPDLVISDNVVRIPENAHQERWESFPLKRLRRTFLQSRTRASHFLGVFLPGLISVIKGDLALVGVQPRSASEVSELSEDWRALYLKTKAGLVTDAVVHFSADINEDELRTSESYYSATESFTNDLKLLSQYLLKMPQGTSYADELKNAGSRVAVTADEMGKQHTADREC